MKRLVEEIMFPGWVVKSIPPLTGLLFDPREGVLNVPVQWMWGLPRSPSILFLSSEVPLFYSYKAQNTF